ncbi:NAD(P)-dependent oxidoreductase [Nocardia sp. 2YAB30]|uniref:NAD(P)-dependent oxidoreductase n=1 Tax=Nocardia sp. 2YAB30 TaxID=3233022 RepID=UPI003F9CED07
MDYCTEEVADHTLASIPGLRRWTASFDAAVRAGQWDLTALPPRRIAGTVSGSYGFGRIGTAVARRAGALDMDVRACGRSLGPRASRAQSFAPTRHPCSNAISHVFRGWAGVVSSD